MRDIVAVGASARNTGSRAIGVVLSGMLKDGTQGLKAIKEPGGVAFVQSPEEAGYPEVSENAIRYDGPIDLIAPATKLAEQICSLVAEQSSPEHKL